jgi:O2-independent ubiquinone biosynthesis accessory factor UbiT
MRPPELPLALALCAALNVALRSGLLSRSALAPAAGKRVRIELDAPRLGVTVSLRTNYFLPARGRPDVVIRARPRDYLSLALRREDPDTLFFTRRLAIEGDTELGLIVKNALDAIDWDALPAPLARLSARLASRA